MHKALALIVTIIFLLPGCSREQHSAYIGVWQTQEERPKTFEILRDGSTLFLQDLRNYNVQGKLNAPMILSPEGDQLVVKTGVGQAALALRDDGKQLVFDKWTLSKLSASDADQIKTSLANEFSKRAKDRSDCEALGKIFDERENEINRSGDAASVKLDKQRALRAEKVTKASEIRDCKRQLLLY